MYPNGVNIPRFIFLALPLILLSSLAATVASAQDTVCDAYWEQRYDEALKLADNLIGSEAEKVEKLDAYRCKACTYLATKKVDPARISIADMLGYDPNARFSPDTSYPPPIYDLYHAVRDSLFPGTVDVGTIAVGDFEDNSIYTGKFKDYDFSLFQKALVHTINADLASATDLKLVDRQRIDQLTKEIELGKSGFANPEMAVKAGELLGAQTFIFGQYMILSKDKVRIDARVVHTATGEIILTKQVTGVFSGEPEKFLELEQELVIGLAEGIDMVLEANDLKTDTAKRAAAYFDAKGKSIAKRSDYVESKFLIASALEQEDNGEFAAARDLWKKVLDVDPKNEVAPVRIQVLGTLVQG